MKILFVCGGLEPGRDGVGDYSRRLAAALIALGHDVALLAINDKHVDTVVATSQTSERRSMPVLQIPSGFSNADLIRQAKSWIDEFNPGIISLQFVPFGFHHRGLKIGLSKTLLAIGNGQPWHMMFHELWVGMAVEESQKLKWWGRLQRLLIKTLARNLSPRVVHTQTGVYQAYLQQMDISAGILPLFGNIPVREQSSIPANDTKDITIVVFGLIHSGAPITDLAREAADYANKHAVRISLIFVGRCGPEHIRWVTEWEKHGLPAKVLGEQSAENISKILSEATFGISATATAVIAKSGAVAAMREHGLPVLSVSKPWTPRNIDSFTIPDGIIVYQKGCFENYLSAASRVDFEVNIATVANQFIGDISKTLNKK